MCAILDGRFSVLAPDRPGWGDNSLPPTDLAGNADWMAGEIEAWGAPLPVTVVGHSLGGGIALAIALDRPDLVGALILVGSVGVQMALSAFDRVLAVPRLGHSVIRAGVASVRSGRRAAERLSGLPVVRHLTATLGQSPAVRALAWLDTQPITERARSSFIVEQRALLADTPSLERRLGLVGVPTAVVHGSLDHIVGRDATRLLACLIPGAEWVSVPGEGHLLPIASPETIAPLVERYARLGGMRAVRTGGA